MSLFIKLATLIIVLDIFLMAATYTIHPEDGIPDSIGRVSSFFVTESEGMNATMSTNINAMSGSQTGVIGAVSVFIDTVGSIISSLGEILNIIVFLLGAPYFFATKFGFPFPANLLFTAVLYVPLFFSLVFALLGRQPQ